MLTPYPGKLIDDETGFRVLKCYIYKFIKGNIKKRPRFDVKEMRFSQKKYYWFNTLRPMFGAYHNERNIEPFHNLKDETFISDEKKIYFMPQYYQSKNLAKRNSYIYCCNGAELKEYFSSMKISDLQNITIFNSSFTWALDLFDETLPHPKNEMDILIYVKRP